MRLYQIAKEKKGRAVFDNCLQDGELRDQVGKIVGMSGRNLGRYLNLLKSSTEVQDAYQDGHLTLVQAARVSTLPEEDQEALADRLRAGEDAKTVFAEFFPQNNGRHVKPADAVAAFVRSIEAGIKDLDGRVDQVSPGVVGCYKETLRKGRKLIRLLLAKLGVEE